MLALAGCIPRERRSRSSLSRVTIRSAVSSIVETRNPFTLSSIWCRIPTHSAADHRRPLPHRLGDREPEPLTERFQRDHRRLALERVHQRRVLVAQEGEELDYPAAVG